MEIEWDTPAPPASGRKRGKAGKYVELFDALRTRPGEWAVLARDTYVSAGQAVERGHLSGCEPGEFEAVTRRNGHGGTDVYVRYIGG